jgi:tRNA pseudouridine55 synthase
VVDKPAGPTSHDVVDRVRRALGTRRVGHTGTLDPFATGVLPVCIGKATRLARFLAAGEKVYRATVRLGFATSTDDLTGDPLGPPVPVRADRDAIEAACRAFVGTIPQVPPAYSAKRVGGRRLYALAREGTAVRPDAVPVTILELSVAALEADLVEVDVRCSPGTYVRSLARDLGERLGTGGHLAALRRTRSGEFDLAGAVGWERLESDGPGLILPVSALLHGIPEVRVGPEGAAALRHGRDLDQRWVSSPLPQDPPPRIRILSESGELLALAVPRGFGPPGELPIEPVLHPDVVLVD